MSYFIPDAARTFAVLGDTHHGTVHADVALRAAKAQAAVVNGSKTRPVPAAIAHVGDIVETGVAGEYATATPWWNAFPNPKILAVGNHDIFTGTMADWLAQYGYATPSNYIDTTYFRIIAIYWDDLNQGTAGGSIGGLLRDWVIARAAEVSVPCALMFHLPPRNTFTAGAAPRDAFDSLTPYTFALGTAATTNLDSIIAAATNLKVLLHGHTHSWWDAPGLAALYLGQSGTARPVLTLNAGALTYLGIHGGDQHSPLVIPYVTLPAAGGVETRLLDCAGDSWMPRAPGLGLVETWSV